MRKFLILLLSLAAISLSACSEHGDGENGQTPNYLSTLDKDKEVVFDVAQAWADCFGDYYKTGYYMWSIYLQAYDTREQIYVEFLTSSTELVVPTGKFTVAAIDRLCDHAIIPGMMTEEEGEQFQTFSWFIKIDPSSTVVPVYIEQAPIVGGEMTITEVSEGLYDFTFDFKDDADNRIYGTYKGGAVVEDFRPQ